MHEFRVWRILSNTWKSEAVNLAKAEVQRMGYMAGDKEKYITI